MKIEQRELEAYRREPEMPETIESQSAHIYEAAADMLEEYQLKRAREGKQIGCQGSLLDGLAWLFDHVDKLERK